MLIAAYHPSAFPGGGAAAAPNVNKVHGSDDPKIGWAPLRRAASRRGKINARGGVELPTPWLAKLIKRLLGKAGPGSIHHHVDMYIQPVLSKWVFSSSIYTTRLPICAALSATCSRTGDPFA